MNCVDMVPADNHDNSHSTSWDNFNRALQGELLTLFYSVDLILVTRWEGRDIVANCSEIVYEGVLKVS